MMGKSKNNQAKLFYHNISLERRVPKEHLLRKIKKLVEFDLIRSQVADLYVTNGNQFVDPLDPGSTPGNQYVLQHGRLVLRRAGLDQLLHTLGNMRHQHLAGGPDVSGNV